MTEEKGMIQDVRITRGIARYSKRDFWSKVWYQLNMLKHRPRLFWNRLWIRKDEFHPSLDMDALAMLTMNSQDRDAYIADLIRRREIAHRKEGEI